MREREERCSDAVELQLGSSSLFLWLFNSVDLERQELQITTPLTVILLAALNLQPECAASDEEKQPTGRRVGLEQKRADQ